MTKSTEYLSLQQTLLLKGLAILCIISHNFFRLLPPVEYQNEMRFEAKYFPRFLQEFSFSEILNCLFSFFGFYGVYIFIFLSGYGLTKAFTQNKLLPVKFVSLHIAKIYKLFLISVSLYLIIGPTVPTKALLTLLSLTTNLDPSLLFIICGPWCFFSLIIQLYILFYPLYTFFKKDKNNVILVFFSWLCITIYWINYVGSPITLFANALGHLPEFSLGIFIAVYEKELKILENKKFNLIAWILAILIVITAQTNRYIFIMGFTASVFTFLCPIKLFKTENSFLIFSGKISPYLFGFNGFLYRSELVDLAKNSNSALMENFWWLIWLIINYAFAYTFYVFLKKDSNGNNCMKRAALHLFSKNHPQKKRSF